MSVIGGVVPAAGRRPPAQRAGRREPGSAPEGTLLPVTRLDPATLAPEERFDAYCDAAGEAYDLSVTDRDARQRGITGTGWHLGELYFIDATSAGLVFTRRPRHLQQSGEGSLRLLIHKTDGTRLAIGDTVKRLDRRAIHLVDVEREQVLVTEPHGVYTAIYMRHSAIGYDPARHPAYLRIDPGSGKGVILDATLRTLYGVLDSIQVSEVPAIATAIRGLVRSCLDELGEPAGPGNATRRNRSAAMRAFIEMRLGDPELGFPALAEAFGASRSTIFRDFESYGGVDRYITQRRLEQAYVNLLRRHPSPGAVSKVAHGCGFNSAGYFCRRFRAEFGHPPSGVLGSAASEARIGTAGGPTGSLFGQFLGQGARAAAQ